MKNNKPLIGFLVMAIAAFALACNDSESPTSPSPPLPELPSEPSPETGGGVLIRVAHLSTDAPPVDIWVNGQVVLSNVPFKTVSDYLELSPGEYQIQVTPAGTTAPIVIDATLNLSGGRPYTVAAVGFLSSGTLEPLIIRDNLNLASGAQIRVIHASADTGPVDVAVSGGPVLFGDVRYKQSTAYAEIPGGTYDLEVRAAGTNTAALPLPDVTVSDATNYSVFAVGRSFNGSLEALVVIDAP